MDAILADEIFRCIFVNEKICILIKISLKFVPRGPIDNNPALVQIMTWHRPGDKPLSEPMIVRLPTYVCLSELINWHSAQFFAERINCFLGFDYIGATISKDYFQKFPIDRVTRSPIVLSPTSIGFYLYLDIHNP